MATKVIPFFATRGDLISLASEINSQREVRYVLAGIFDDPTVQALVDVNAIESLSTYLVVDPKEPVEMRAIDMNTGERKYALDQMLNPNSLMIHTGGRISEHQVIQGQLGTIGEGPKVTDLHKLFAKTIRRRFQKIKSHYVGPEAVADLERGVRLSTTAKSPIAYDLTK